MEVVLVIPFMVQKILKNFANGGNNILNMGIGDDMVSYAPGRGASTDYTITNVGDEVHVTGPNTKDIIIGGRYIEFMDDNKIIDTQYFQRPIISTYTKLIYSFEDDTKTEVYIYAGDEISRQTCKLVCRYLP